MQKKILVVAVAGALASPLAFAQSSVTLSGSIRSSIDFNRVSGNKGTNANKMSVSDNTSRFRLNGVENLGGGLNAEFDVEVRLNNDTGLTATAQRQQYVGLSGGWGAFRIGNQNNPYDDMTYDGSILNPINGSTTHTSNVIIGNFAMGGFQVAPLDTRLANTLQYYSPNFGGFTGRVIYKTPDNKTTVAGTNDSAWGIGLDYTSGPLRLGYSYETAKNAVTAAQATTLGTVLGLGAAGAGDNKTKGHRLAAFYSLPSKTHLGTIFETIKLDLPAFATGAADPKRRSWQLGVLQEFGANHQVWASYTRGSKSKNLGGATIDDKGTLWQMGYKNLLSKRSQVYVAYSRLNNSAGASYAQATNGYTYTLGNTDSAALSVGMKHDF